MATKKRDPATIDMFTGTVDPPVIPKNRALVATSQKTEPVASPSAPSVPSIPKPTTTIGAHPVLLKPVPGTTGPNLDLPLFPHGYLIILFLALAALGVVIGDNLFDLNIAASIIQSRAHISNRIDQYVLAVVRSVPAIIIGVLTLCCAVHLARRQTTAVYARYLVAGIFALTGAALVAVTYICERDYMVIGLCEIGRRLGNIAGMRW